MRTEMALAVVLISSIAPTVAADPPLRAPFDVEALRAAHGARAAGEPVQKWSLADLGAANGVDLRGRGHGALGRLAARCLDGLRDHAFGDVAQDVGSPAAPDEAAWLEIELARGRDKRILPLLEAQAGKLDDPLIGGDVTLLYGRR